MRYFLKFIVAVLAYFVGLGAYVGVLRAVWHEGLTGCDAEAVIFWGGLAYLLVAIPLYLLAF